MCRECAVVSISTHFEKIGLASYPVVGRKNNVIYRDDYRQSTEYPKSVLRTWGMLEISSCTLVSSFKFYGYLALVISKYRSLVPSVNQTKSASEHSCEPYLNSAF